MFLMRCISRNVIHDRCYLALTVGPHPCAVDRWV